MIFLGVLASILIICFGLVVLRGAPYIPSHRSQVRRAFTELYTLSKHDRVVDLGSGDGTVLAIADECGAKALGYEINPILWLQCTLRFRNKPGIDTQLKDYNLIDALPRDVTVVYAFTTSRSIETIGKKLEQWSKSQELYFISYGFTFHDRKYDKKVGPMHLYHFSRKS